MFFVSVNTTATASRR